MKQLPPSTPFSTPLSGSARQAEERIRNLFQGPKRRPPVWLMALVLLLILSCGGLVSCRSLEIEPSPSAGQGSSTVSFSWSPDPRAYTLIDGEAPAELEELEISQLPAQPADLSRWDRSENWRQLVYLLDAVPGHDAALYGVVRSSDPGLAQPSSKGTCGLLLRCQDALGFYPFAWWDNQWMGIPPELLIDDFDRDGAPEGAVVLAVGHGTGTRIEDLYFFDLDTLEWTSPDCSTLELEVEYASDDRTVTLTAGDQQAEVSLSDYIPAQGEFTGIGSAVRSFSLENGQFYASYSLYFTCEDLPPTTVYLADVRAPVLFREGRWQLGEGDFRLQNPEYWSGGLKAVRWTGADGAPLVAHSQEELLALFPPPQSDP